VKILVIAPESFFTPRGTPLSVYYRTSVLSKLGAHIDLLTYGQGEDVDIPDIRIYRIPHFSFLGSVKVGPSFLKLILDILLLIWTFVLVAKNRYTVVHAHEESIFFAHFLKPLFRFNLVYDMHSSLPQQLLNFKFTKSKLLIRLFEWLENRSLEAADAVITICPELARYAMVRMPDPNRHFLIENSIFDEVNLKKGKNGNSINPPPIFSNASLDGRPLIVYAGTFEKYQGLEILIRAFQKVHGRKPDIFLLIIGGNPEQVDAYQKLALDLGLMGHCAFTGRLNQTQARFYSSRATVLVSPRILGNNTPLKIYEQLASGIPLVATRVLSHTQTLNGEVCFLADPNPIAMAEGIWEALTDLKKREAKIKNAKQFYSEKYSKEVYEDKVAKFLEVLG